MGLSKEANGVGGTLSRVSPRNIQGLVLGIGKSRCSQKSFYLEKKESSEKR